MFQTFEPTDGMQMEQDISEIRTLLDEDNEVGEQS